MKNFFIIIFLAVCPAILKGQCSIEYQDDVCFWQDEMVWVFDDVYECDEKKDFIVFPNPTSDYFEIKGEFSECTLIDLNGNILLKTKSKVIDVLSFPNGIYFLRIDNKVLKVVKM